MAIFRKALATAAIALPAVLTLALVPPDSGTSRLKPKVRTRAVTTSAPSGYVQVGNTELFFYSTNFDFYGRIGNSYYGSTSGNLGYYLSIQVNSNSAQHILNNQSTTTDGVTCTPRVEQQGEFGRVVYSVFNGNDTDAVVSLGTYANVMIGSNDHAPITRLVDTTGATYGLSMKDNGAAQLCVLFGSGLAGVNGVDDFWFDHYDQNTSASAMVGNYTQGKYFMVENGSYNSGMGWCWKNRTVPAGETVEFSYLIGVGDVNLEPTSSFTATIDDPESWNTLYIPKEITITGVYESPAGQNGRIEYSVEDSEEWTALTDELTSGSEFSETATVMFDYNTDRACRYIRFRTIDIVGNVTMLNPMAFKDLRNLSNRLYTKSPEYNFGEPVYPDITCSLPDEQYVITSYTNTTQAGRSCIYVEGVFPYSIGQSGCAYEIIPKSLEGSVIVADTVPTRTFNQKAHCPAWRWEDERFSNLVEGIDYSVLYIDNVNPGTATVQITGKGNFRGSIFGDFVIEKAPIDLSAFTIKYPADVIYTGYPVAVSITTSLHNLTNKVHPIWINTADGSQSTSASEPGEYRLFLKLDENPYYLNDEMVEIGLMTITALNEDDFNAFVALRAALEKQTDLPWAATPDQKSAAQLNILTFENGRITGLNLENLGIERLPDEIYALDALTSLNLRGNALSGNVTDIAAKLPALTSLDVSNNHFTSISPAIPANITDFTFYGQTFDVDIDLTNINISGISSASLAALLPDIALYQHLDIPYAINGIAFHGRDTRGEWWPTYTVMDNFGISIAAGERQNIYHGKSGDIMPLNVVTYFNNSSHSNSQNVDVRLTFAPGDINFNGKVDVSDLQLLINYILKRLGIRVPFNFTAADLWEDERLNVQDIVLHTNILTSSHPEADNATRRLRSLADNAADAARVYCRNGQLIIDSPTPVAAFDIVVTGNSAQLTSEIRSLGFTAAVVVKDGYAHIIGYSLSGAEIPAGQYAVADVDDAARAYSCTLSDIDANIIPSAAGQHTGIDGIAVNGTAIHLDGNRLYLTTANGGHCRWSIHTTAGTLIAAGECETVAGTNLLTTLDGINTMAIATVETAGGRTVTKIVAGQYTNH